MSRLPKPESRSSAALLVSVVALVAALGGGAVAGVTVSALNKKEKRQVTRIAKKQGKSQARNQITKRAPQLDVRSAERSATAGSADRAGFANRSGSANTAAFADSSGDAVSVGGVETKLFDWVTNTLNTEEILLERDGLRVYLGCNAEGDALIGFRAVGDNGILGLWRGATSPVGHFPFGHDFDTGTVLEAGTNLDALGDQQAVGGAIFRATNGEKMFFEFVVTRDSSQGQCIVTGTMRFA